MASAESQRIRITLVNDRDSLDVPLEIQRKEWQDGAAQTTLPPGINITPVDVAGIPGEWISGAEAVQNRVLYFLHGGGYTAGSCVTHRELAANLYRASGIRVLLLDYRLAPEHPFPAAVDDAIAGYEWLLKCGIKSEHIVIGGDSAGGGLTVATLVRLRDQGIALPAAAVLLSPWLDLSLSGPTMQTRASLDPVCSIEGLTLAANWYLGGTSPQTPLASPLFADLQGLSPLLIQVGDHEILLSDSTRLAEKARAAGVEVALEVWDEMWHTWQAFAPEFPEKQQAIERIGEFVWEQLPTKVLD